MHIVTICGSLRKESYNRRLLGLAEAALVELKAEVDFIDLREHPLPLYDADIESENGLPPEIWKIKARIAAAQGIVIASPEYNGSIPGALKNMIDWTSRGESQPWAVKVIGLMGATTGMWGTQRMMPHLRQSFQILGGLVIPQQVNVREAGKVWNAEGILLDEKLPGSVEKFAREFLQTVQRVKGQ